MSRERPPQPRGDEAELYSRLHGPLQRIVRGRVSGPQATVEDACSFAWEQLLCHQPARGESLLSWLSTVAIREGWRLVRIERRATPAGPAQLARALQALQALAGLRPAEKRLLALRAAGFSYRELMAIERRTYTWVNRHVTRASRHVRETDREGGEN